MDDYWYDHTAARRHLVAVLARGLCWISGSFLVSSVAVWLLIQPAYLEKERFSITVSAAILLVSCIISSQSYHR